MRESMKIKYIAWVLGSAALAAGLAGCASAPASHYYSLMPEAVDAAPGQAASAQASYTISVSPVQVPEQVDKPQIVLNEPDSAQVTPLGGYLWAAKLSEEVRSALADDLSRRLGALEAPPANLAKDQGNWQVNVKIQRFDSYYGNRAVLDASWALTPHNIRGGRPAYCRARISVPVADGMSALVKGHQDALWKLSALIAGKIQPATAQDDIGELEFNRCT
jgi:uncharacterized lipoprotein YmbA